MDCERWFWRVRTEIFVSSWGLDRDRRCIFIFKVDRWSLAILAQHISFSYMITWTRVNALLLSDIFFIRSLYVDRGSSIYSNIPGTTRSKQLRRYHSLFPTIQTLSSLHSSLLGSTLTVMFSPTVPPMMILSWASKWLRSLITSLSSPNCCGSPRPDPWLNGSSVELWM